jgi:hypothetical protein
MILLSSKNTKKNLDFNCFLWLLYDFLSFKNDVNVPSKSNKKKKNSFILFAPRRSRKKTARSESGSIGQRHGYADPDPYKKCHVSTTVPQRRRRKLVPMRKYLPTVERKSTMFMA